MQRNERAPGSTPATWARLGSPRRDACETGTEWPDEVGTFPNLSDEVFCLLGEYKGDLEPGLEKSGECGFWFQVEYAYIPSPAAHAWSVLSVRQPDFACSRSIFVEGDHYTGKG